MPLDAAVAHDYMCEPFMLERTGLTVADHQRLTISRYGALSAQRLPCYVLPVLQGYNPADYVRHVEAYGHRLAPHSWMGVGSVCKRNARPESGRAVLAAIKNRRPNLRLHGCGVKLTSLANPAVRRRLYSADSMAWSFAARKQGRNPNDWREAEIFTDRVMGRHHGPICKPVQASPQA
jgi:hypothetical protein